MKKTLLLIGLLTISSLAFGANKILICGSGWGSFALLDKDANKLEWEHKVENFAEMNTICLDKKGNIVVTNKYSIMCLDPKTKEVIWTYKAKGEGKNKEEIHSVVLDNKGVLKVGICGLPSRIIDLNDKGEQVAEITFESGSKTIHPQFRQFFINKDNNYIIPLYSGKAFLELDKNGKLLEKVDMPIRLFSAMPLKNGNYLLSGEYGKLGAGQTPDPVLSKVRIVEYSPKTKSIVRTIDTDSVEGCELLFACQIRELDNGNLLITNFNGHSRDKTQPKLIEIDKNNKLVWKIDAKLPMKNLTGTYILK